MKKENFQRYQIYIAAIIFVLAIIRLFDIKNLNNLMDSTFILLLFVSLILFLIPFEKISSLKAGGVEIELFENKIKNAIEGLEIKKIENEHLYNAIIEKRDKIETIKGSRVLWIDDTPISVLGERRILRSLGLDIHSANNRQVVLDILDRDIDFDLIISDIQWLNDSNDRNSNFYGGIQLAKEIRQKFKNEPINLVKTIFYTSFTKDQIDIIHTQTDFLSIENVILCYTIEELLTSVINSLNEINKNPIKVTSSKSTFYRNK